jgi:hypothetical protein
MTRLRPSFITLLLFAPVASACMSSGGGGGGDGFALDTGGGDAAEVDADTAGCVAVCAADATRCDGDGVSTCVVDAATGCLVWGGPVACAGGLSCSNGVCSAVCSDECLPAGTALCEGQAAKRCGQYDSDSCLDWSALEPCRANELCINGACVVQCQDECGPVGVVGCDGDGTRSCGQFDSDSCLDWSVTTACSPGESCSNGSCSAGCDDECLPSGTRLCEAGGVKTCGQYDSDVCLDWSAVVSCGAQSCVNGECVGSTCQDSCPGAGQKRCDAGGRVQTCQLGADSCLAWTAGVACPGANESCVDGVCTQGCPVECGAVGDQVCSGANGYRVCGVDPASGCDTESSFISCQPHNSCSGGDCGGACVVPEILFVVDRSSSMLGSVWDYTRSRLLAAAEAVEGEVKIGARVFPAGGSGCDPGAIVGLALDNASGLEGALLAPSDASSTPLAAALTGLTPSFGDPNQGEHVVLITDGSETCGTTASVLDQVQLLANRGTTVHAIGVGSGFDSELLDDIAAIGGGGSYAASSSTALRDVLKELIADVTSCPSVAYGWGTCGSGGSCQAVGCSSGYHACAQQCRSNTDATACGATCKVCPGATHGAAVCDSGACAIACDVGYVLINGACTACYPATHAGDLVINEFMADPGLVDYNGNGTSEPSADEWIELVNRSGHTVFMQGVRVMTGPPGATAEQHAFGGLCIPAGHAIVLFGDAATTLTGSGVTYLRGDGSLSLNNNGDRIELIGADGTLFDGHTYTTSAAEKSWTRAPDGTGAFVRHDNAPGGSGWDSMGACIGGGAFPGCLAP